MDGAINFTMGLSEGIAWPWPIAVYLFLAGISGGAVAVALMLNFFRHKTETTPIIKSASIIGLATILLGMLCLVLDLTNPLYFWRILVYYNPTSVMSIGVMLLLFYIPLVAVLMVMSFADTFSKWPLLGWVKPVCDQLEKFRVWINAIRDGAGNCHLCLHRFPDLCADPLPTDQHGRASRPLRCFRYLCRYGCH